MMALAWRTLPYALGVLALLFVYNMGVGHADLRWSAKWAERDTAEAVAARALIERNQQIVAEVQDSAEIEIEKANADAVAAGNAAERMRQQAAKLAARCNAPAATSSSPATESPAMVLADVLARVDAVAGELATAYDAARIAGKACEATYNQVR